MELVLGLGAVAIVLIVGWQLRSARKASQQEDADHAKHQDVVAKNIQPVSLHPLVNLGACIGSGTCVTSCPEKDVLAVIDGKAQIVNPTACIGHGECLRACPVDAIQLVIGTEKRGVEIPLLETDFQTNVPGLYIVGELGGMGLIYNAMTQGLQCLKSVTASPPPRVPGVHQVVIVGAGPAGIAAGLAALEAKLDFAVVDQESIGGTVLHYPRHKIVMTRPVELPLYGKLKVGAEISKESLLEVWKEILAKTGLEVRTGVRVDELKKGADGVFELKTSAGVLKAQRVVLAMGRRGTPRKLGVPGEEQAKVVYRLLEPERYAGATCLVVGGGDAAVEAAIALGDAGATVHLAHRGKVFDRIKPKNQERLNAATGSKVTVLLEAAAKEIGVGDVTLDVGGKPQVVKNDYVLIFAGGVLPTAFLEKAGVQVKTMKGEVFAPANR